MLYTFLACDLNLTLARGQDLLHLKGIVQHQESSASTIESAFNIDHNTLFSKFVNMIKYDSKVNISRARLLN